MVHREVISIEDYRNEFEIPYLSEFADTFRKYVTKSGVKSCFCLDMPIYLPNELKPVQIVLKRKGMDSFDCIAGAFRTQYLWDSNLSNLKDEVLKGFQFTREWDDEIGEVYFYGIHLSTKIFSQIDIDLSFKKIVTGVYRISDNGWIKHEIRDFSSLRDLCNIYGVEYDERLFEMTLPNVSTKYSIRKFFDFVQFICAISQ